MADYSQYQGPSSEWEAFVQKTSLPLGDLTLPPQTIRQASNALRVKISETEIAAEDLRTKAAWRDYSVLTRDQQNIIARVYRPRELPPEAPLPIYLYFHGGGHLLGTIETEDAACLRLAVNAQVTVVNVNYRHTPEFKHPYQVNDAWDAFEWLARNASLIGGDPSRVIVGGVSAGAGLAASVIVRQHNNSNDDDSAVRDQGRNTSLLPRLNVCGQLLCIPWLIHPDNHPFTSGPAASFQQNVSAAVLPMALLRLFSALLGADDVKDPALNVALVDDRKIMGLPKTTFVIAGQDLLRDEGLYYAEKLKKAGFVHLPTIATNPYLPPILSLVPSFF
ncbi:hypothetical protein AYL99_08666 [Fonsecaea erecta]|uniref:Alpha/beta hydrolase fold-3 domain-containing protein n=1 Tax=Fonsecaea erecta TaxID=1367422 RepID=A0A178ZDT5_9EURO|nr:hypothetical protein AYL99_08666 [Fonsecaea erecta]OAP57928.1 hypothetical protein AYL99_08666 [Fonsecaea erecta]